MSLLNDALRAAEHRQHRPEAPSAYTGHAVQGGQGGRRWLVILLLLIMLVAGIATAYWLVTREMTSPSADSTVALAESREGEIQRSQAAEADPQPASSVETRVEIVAPAPSEPERESSTKTSPAPEPRVADQLEKPEPEVAAREPAESARAASEQQPQEAESNSATVEPEESETPVVKTTPQSPEANDRQTAKNLESLVSDGRIEEAERRLAGLIQTQEAPLSRFVVARALLVEGDPGRALNWLPSIAAGRDARLRMLRARALHANGELQAALETLQSRVPAVADQPEYRVTLATLLQQQGNSEEAARHWAELIAWDDSKAPWWVGLAISLEDQGQVRSAARAYEQAAALPGLSPSLADYVQRRLRSLRAG
ncbi:tetratricopeptide repeat protein [Marinobacter sp. CHS3-4]|uniref:tetratricopeptide repeat protein n=1 Tax=Marinobacter sp. CHS3-4 TaxID=3045174 RepID=UPI0024B5C36E|nr:tetratricopeptide repeat protein [Marinobacter sp. CHS3-4]MDI9246670.1 tetratricopeptide repeat protein [Marinobacter sp. CHS3-4]